MKNQMKCRNYPVVAWTAQSTMDYNFRFQKIEDLIGALNSLLGQKLFFQYQDIFKSISEKGLNKDFEDKKSEGQAIQESVKFLKKSLDHLIFSEFSGGSPYISAEFGYHLQQSDSSLPITYFCGNLPRPVQEYNAGKKNLEEMCQYALPIDKCPGTLSLELPPYKIMLASSEGRKLTDFDASRFLENLEEIAKKHGQENIILAIGGLNSDPAESYSSLIRSVKEKFPEMKIFIGTNSFANKTPEEVRKYWEVLKLGDIISFNDEELKTVYDAVYSPRSISLARKLKELEHPGIKICHAAEGTILDPGYHPEKIVRNPCFLENPKKFLEKALTLAAEGATFIYERPKSLGYPDSLAVQLYSQNIQTRWQDGFRTKFVFPDSELANGLLGLASAKVEYSLGRQTGTGAFFDSGFLSFLFSLILFRRGLKWQK